VKTNAKYQMQIFDRTQSQSVQRVEQQRIDQSQLTYFAFNYSSPSKALAQVDQTQTPEDGSLAQRYSEVRIDTSKGLSPEQQVRELLFNSTKRASEPQGARSSSQMMAEQ
jgi:hypothetical protein